MIDKGIVYLSNGVVWIRFRENRLAFEGLYQRNSEIKYRQFTRKVSRYNC